MDFPYLRVALSNLFRKSSCEMYPIKPSEAAPNYRGRIVYHSDRCIGCGMCERVCAGNAISHTTEKREDGELYSMTFNLGSCTFCATCADFCSRSAIELTRDYHMIATKDEDLLVKGSFVKAPPKKPAPKPAAKPAAAPAAAPAPAAPAASAPAEVKPREDGKPVNDPARCVYCTLCARKCPAEALTVNRAEKTWECDYEKCIGCGTCAEACPKKCIIL